MTLKGKKLMGKISNIEWTDATWNPWQGCHKVSAGCENCYMYREKKRFGQDPEKVIRSSDKTFYAPLKWKEPKRIMVCSWSDFFIPEADPWRREAIEIMKACPQHTFIIPTKRTERIIHCLYGGVTGGPDGGYLKKVWFLASVENQETANRRISELQQLRKLAPWTVLGISAEPMLGNVEFRHLLNRRGYQWNALDWIICGGESGPNARPTHPDWVRSLRDQAVAAGIPFFFKQWGEWAGNFNYVGMKTRIPLVYEYHRENGEIITKHGNSEQAEIDGKCVFSFKVGKKKAGRLLDGREWNEMPTDCGCINCGETDVPLNDDGLCEHCYNEFSYQEEKERQQKYADRLAEEKKW